jgi:hypothetical protein
MLDHPSYGLSASSEKFSTFAHARADLGGGLEAGIGLNGEPLAQTIGLDRAMGSLYWKQRA